MKRIEINIKGPVQSGKSIILAAIDKTLRDMNIQFRLSEELEAERNLGNPDNPEEWEFDMLKNVYVVLTETTES